jgi:hypothetical protein
LITLDHKIGNNISVRKEVYPNEVQYRTKNKLVDIERKVRPYLGKGNVCNQNQQGKEY